MADSDRQLEELILYIAEVSEGDPHFGATKLNKILFYSDFRAYDAFGRSISGQDYQKLSYGPAPVRLLPAVEALIERKAAVWADREYFGRPQRKLISLRRADLSLFSAREVDLVHHVIQELWELNGSEVSDLSHRFAGWLAAADREVIPYATVAVDEPRPLTEEEIAWAHEAIDGYLAATSH